MCTHMWYGNTSQQHPCVCVVLWAGKPNIKTIRPVKLAYPEDLRTMHARTHARTHAHVTAQTYARTLSNEREEVERQEILVFVVGWGEAG